MNIRQPTMFLQVGQLYNDVMILSGILNNLSDLFRLKALRSETLLTAKQLRVSAVKEDPPFLR